MQLKFDDFLPPKYPGPISRAAQSRAKTVYLILASFGFALALFGNSNGLQAFGLGLVFPGAGFLQYVTGGWLSVVSHVGMLLLTLGLFLAALVFSWFWNGNIISPIAVWLLSAVGAGAMNHHHSFQAAPLLVLGLVSVFVLYIVSVNRKKRKILKENLEYRRANIAEINIPESPVDSKSGLRTVSELRPEDLKLLRYAYDRALQPIDEWNGFAKSFNSEWQISGTRYQIMFLCWALSFTNYNSLPAMRTYLQDAQLNMIDKTKQYFVWSYWRWERLWGTFKWNPDPFPIHNMMFTGYLAKTIGLYQNATGDLRHNEEGSYTLEGTRGERHVYDFPKICTAVEKQYQKNGDYYIACEPNFKFSICNAMGNTAMASRSTSLINAGRDSEAKWKELQPLYREHQINEFTNIDGGLFGGKMAYLGMPFAPPGFPPTFVNLLHAAHMSPALPDVAACQYAMAKLAIVKEGDDGLELNDLDLLTAPDPATFKKSHGWLMGNFLLAAKEHGDTEVAEFVEGLIDEHIPSITSDGVRYFPEEAVVAHAKIIMGRVTSIRTQYDLVNKGSPKEWLDGPLLTGAIYPKVQVAKAVSDGVNLELVMYPENESDTQEIELSQLRAKAEYMITGSRKNEQNFSADAEGKATLSIHLDGRTELHFQPV